MAQRRGFGNRLGDLADLLLRSHLQSQQAERQNEMVAERERASQQAGFASTLTQDVKSNPEAALRTLMAAQSAPQAKWKQPKKPPCDS